MLNFKVTVLKSLRELKRGNGIILGFLSNYAYFSEVESI